MIKNEEPVAMNEIVRKGKPCHRLHGELTPDSNRSPYLLKRMKMIHGFPLSMK
ncbi:MAG: hypothetical protein HW406_458 [Candidatus Brocadiaceae bacterium]|nr:hypothetical protein [Candidatus Brocadiaceae bacterium]